MKGLMLSAAAAGAVLLSSLPAAADHHTATRCDWRGCSHIVCNHTGDRCHRYFGNYYREGYYRDSYSRRPYRYGRYDGTYGEGYGRDRDGWHYDCDRDADQCHVQRGDNDRDWDD